LSLFTKYPELEPLSLLLEAKKGSFEQMEAMPEKVNAEVLFIFGIFPISKDFRSFLKAHPKTEVVFIVDSLSELLSFIHEGLDRGFFDERVHVHWKEEDDWIETVLSKFPYQNMAFLQNGLEENEFESIRKTFLRKGVLESAVHQELMYYPQLCKNLISNVYKISNAFDIGQWKDAFKAVPAIIAGAGPSLKSVENELKELGDKALIFAGGTTIASLSQMDIEPHLAFAIDPNFEEYERLRLSNTSATPLIYGNRVQKDVFRFFSGALGYLRTDTGGLFETHMDNKLKIDDHKVIENLSEEALSVTTIALMTAIHLGCSPIYFAGVDLGYKKNERYSGNILTSWESTLKQDDHRETKWMMEKDVIDDVALKHPEVDFFDATGDGLTFKEVKVKRFDHRNFSIQRDLKAKIDNLIKESKFGVKTHEISTALEEVKVANEHLCQMIDEYLKDQLNEKIFTYDVEENLSFQLFFKGMFFALQGPLFKKLRVEGKEESEASLKKNLWAKILKEAQNLRF